MDFSYMSHLFVNIEDRSAMTQERITIEKSSMHAIGPETIEAPENIETGWN